MKQLIKLLFRKMGLDVISKTQVERNDAFFHLKKIIAPGSGGAFFDVGASVGDFSAELNKHFPGFDIYAFEPQPDAFDLLQKKYGNLCKPFTIAFSDGQGEQEFFITKNTYSSSLIKPVETNTGLDDLFEVKKSITVKTDTIDNFCSVHKIPDIKLLKLDIQGAELSALTGAKNMLQKGLIDVIYTEVEFIRFYENQPLYHDIAAYLDKFDYKLYNIYNIVYAKHAAMLWGDAIFLKKEMYEQLIADK